MSKKFVLIPLRTFTDLCSSVKRQGDTITGTVKSFIEDEPKKKKKRPWFGIFISKFCYFLFCSSKRDDTKNKKRKAEGKKQTKGFSSTDEDDDDTDIAGDSDSGSSSHLI